MYGKEEQADTLIEQMSSSKDVIVRYGAMYAIGAAYVGTSNNKAVKKLLHFAVSDVTDDVKRAALTNLGFLLLRKPHSVPDAVKHLAESYNPHLRYGAAMAVGIGCAGSGLNEALKLLAPLTNDQVDFVRQGALIALSMVFIQITETQEPKVATIKKLFNKLIEDKNEDILSRMGAILAQGVINSAGRNATISLLTRDGNLRQNAIVGMMMFMQHWFWYPMLNFISLSLTPTALIGLNSELKVPKSFKVVSNAKPSTFKYPEFIKIDLDKKKEKVVTAVLSTTTKAKARKERKEGKTGQEVSEPVSPDKKKKDEEMASEEKKDGEEEKKEEEKKDEPEPTFQELKNPSRVVKQQELVIEYPRDGRYIPVLQSRFGGFVILREANPSDEVELFYDDEERDQDAPNPDLQTDLKLPEPFEFDVDVQNAPEEEVVNEDMAEN
jgi:26S proteasome regulatory subunit N2